MFILPFSLASGANEAKISGKCRGEISARTLGLYCVLVGQNSRMKVKDETGETEQAANFFSTRFLGGLKGLVAGTGENRAGKFFVRNG